MFLRSLLSRDWSLLALPPAEPVPVKEFRTVSSQWNFFFAFALSHLGAFFSLADFFFGQDDLLRSLKFFFF